MDRIEGWSGVSGAESSCERGTGTKTNCTGVCTMEGYVAGGKRKSITSGQALKVHRGTRTVYFLCWLECVNNTGLCFSPLSSHFICIPLSSPLLFYHLSPIYKLFPNPEVCRSWEDF